MSNLQVIQNITGLFDVRVYNERVARENRKMKGDDEQIAFTASFEPASPEARQFAAHGKPYTDGNGNQRVRVTFKIGGRCRWYDEAAQVVTRPCNADLDGKKFEVSIQYNELAADPANPKAPRGYWVNAIQFREADTNPFTAMAGAAVPVMPVMQPQTQPQQPDTIPPMYGNESTPYTIPSMFDENTERPLPY